MGSRERHFRGNSIHRGMEAQADCGLQNLPGVSTSRRIKALWLVLQGKNLGSSPRSTLAVAGPTSTRTFPQTAALLLINSNLL